MDARVDGFGAGRGCDLKRRGTHHGTGLPDAKPAYIAPSELKSMTDVCSSSDNTSESHKGLKPQIRSRPSKHWRERRCQLHLATHLKELDDEDPACVIHISRIRSLVFNSPDVLHEHFSPCGWVKRVALSNAHQKLEDREPLPSQCLVRVRPSGVGFVVMERPQDVDAIVALGDVQMVHGCEISVQRFQARAEHRQELEDLTPASVGRKSWSNEVSTLHRSVDTDSEVSEPSTCAPSVSRVSPIAFLPFPSF